MDDWDSKPGLLTRIISGVIGAILGAMASLTIAFYIWITRDAFFGEIILTAALVSFILAFIDGERTVRWILRVIPFVNWPP
jgi:uncharacterized membrane protein YeaQ/YmgE (transglycosylase-associated protein family)